MVLPSYSFIFIFLPLTVLFYHFVNSKGLLTLGKIILLLSSLLFYFSLGWKGFAALLISVLVTYSLATYLLPKAKSQAAKKWILATGIILNVLCLMYCKYLTYFELLLNTYTGSSLAYTAIVVPTGISYFTFSQIAFLVDSYRDDTLKYSILDYSLFVSFFPKITVGPIALSTEMIPQFNDNARKKLNYDNMAKGFYRFTLGLSKKLLIADNLGAFVDLGFTPANIGNLGFTNAILTVLGYTLQIYFDFSGYCDLASGICLMLGIDLCENFDSPYSSLSIREFWKRWHITLTRFFTKYVYIPLGGNRKGKVRTYINNLLIFLISGLWHGAATHFILWGAIHGVGMIISKLIAGFTDKLPKFIRWTVTFVFVSFAWVFFRANDVNHALSIFEQIFTGGYKPMNAEIVAASIPVEGQFIQWLILKVNSSVTYYSGCAIILILYAIALYLAAFSKNAAYRTKNFVASKGKIITTVILFVWSILSLSSVTEFIYVNF